MNSDPIIYTVAIGGGEILMVFLAILLLFGSNKIPEFAKMLGKGLREFKRASDEIKKEINDSAEDLKKEIKKDLP